MTYMTTFFVFLTGFLFLGSLYIIYKDNRKYNKPFIEFTTEMLIMSILLVFILIIGFDKTLLFGFECSNEFLIFTVTLAVFLMLGQKRQLLKLKYENELLTILDELTGIGNRKYFNEYKN